MHCRCVCASNEWMNGLNEFRLLSNVILNSHFVDVAAGAYINHCPSSIEWESVGTKIRAKKKLLLIKMRWRAFEQVHFTHQNDIQRTCERREKLLNLFSSHLDIICIKMKIEVIRWWRSRSCWVHSVWFSVTRAVRPCKRPTQFRCFNYIERVFTWNNDGIDGLPILMELSTDLVPDDLLTCVYASLAANPTAISFCLFAVSKHIQSGIMATI